MSKIVIDPVSRIEGHLKIEATVDDGVVKEAKSSGTLFRGFEIILKGRDPRDAQRITQRVCGVCPTAHATASTLSLDSALGIADKVPDNGRLIRNLIFGSNYIQSHVLHFYHLAALDYVDVTSVADYDGDNTPLKSIRDFIGRGELGYFFPRYEGDYRFDKATNQMLVGHYVKALEMRKLAHEMLAIFGGKGPHSVGIVAGGVTEHPTVDKITNFLWRLSALRDFIDNIYVPDVLAVAKTYTDYFEIGGGWGNFLSYGVFELDGTNPVYEKRQRLHKSGSVDAVGNYSPLDSSQITESVKHSWFEGQEWHPEQGQTNPAPDKADGYSFIKSPRYKDEVYEVGPLAAMCVSYFGGHEKVKALVDSVLRQFNADPKVLNSVLGRHAARALEAKLVADAMTDWLLELKPGEPVCAEYEIPDESEGMGITNAPRGALGHWLKIKDKKIAHYQLVVPTTWNAGPRDSKERPGPIEKSIEGTKIKDPENPFEIVRIVRSFDPCLACAVHVINAKGRELRRFQIV